VPLVIGAGSSPGIINALALRVAEGYDELDELVLTWVVGEYGPAGVAPLRHFFFGITQEIPIWREGAEEWVPAFTRESEEEFDFPPPLGRFAVRDVGHPETVTLPRVLNVRSVRNKGALLPPNATRIYETLKRLGLLGDDSVEVNGVKVVARDFIAEFLTQRHNRKAADGSTDVMGFGVRAEGMLGGRQTHREIATAAHMTMGDATSVPAAAAMPQLLAGAVPPGVHGPEALDVQAWFAELSRLEPGLYADVEVGEREGSPRVATSLTEVATRGVGDLLADGQVA
jgi:saccharopine dehydrogenase-like NADP-dependent oxidoreductase